MLGWGVLAIAKEPRAIVSAVRSGQQQPTHMVIITPERIHSLTSLCEFALIEGKPYKAETHRVAMHNPLQPTLQHHLRPWHAIPDALA
jgi:hypothetical protein